MTIKSPLWYKGFGKKDKRKKEKKRNLDNILTFLRDYRNLCSLIAFNPVHIPCTGIDSIFHSLRIHSYHFFGVVFHNVLKHLQRTHKRNTGNIEL